MAWVEEAGLRMGCYVEGDPWLYWLQPVLTLDAGVAHKLRRQLAQGISLALGIPATCLRYQLWQPVSGVFARLTRSKPTQAAFVCYRRVILGCFAFIFLSKKPR